MVERQEASQQPWRNCLKNTLKIEHVATDALTSIKALVGDSKARAPIV